MTLPTSWRYAVAGATNRTYELGLPSHTDVPTSSGCVTAWTNYIDVFTMT